MHALDTRLQVFLGQMTNFGLARLPCIWPRAICCSGLYLITFAVRKVFIEEDGHPLFIQQPSGLTCELMVHVAAEPEGRMDRCCAHIPNFANERIHDLACERCITRVDMTKEIFDLRIEPAFSISAVDGIYELEPQPIGSEDGEGGAVFIPARAYHVRGIPHACMELTGKRREWRIGLGMCGKHGHHQDRVAHPALLMDGAAAGQRRVIEVWRDIDVAIRVHVFE